MGLGRISTRLWLRGKTQITSSMSWRWATIGAFMRMFLLYIFGDFTQSHRDHNMFENKEVLDLWAKFSDEGMTRVAAEEHLM